MHVERKQSLKQPGGVPDPLRQRHKKGGVAREVCHRNHRYPIVDFERGERDPSVAFLFSARRKIESGRGSVSVSAGSKNWNGARDAAGDGAAKVLADDLYGDAFFRSGR
jgi:hypothetical protein